MTETNTNLACEDLEDKFTGELDFSDATRALYSTDASIYQLQPAGVAFPKSPDDVQALINFARDSDISVTPRGAGSSLTGNAIGEGIVVDCERHLNEIIDVNLKQQRATVEPGVVLENLNRELKQYGLQFSPDPSTSSTCTVGGMVANDAAGPHSLRYGTTAENVVSVTAVLSDGAIGTFEPKAGAELEETCSRNDSLGRIYQTLRDIHNNNIEEIRCQYPDVDRNSSGYNLRDCSTADGSWVDPSAVITGSEGTLCFLTRATLSLDPLPETKAAALVFYDSLDSAARAVSSTLVANPSAVELVDDAVLGYARDAWGYDIVPDDVGAALLVEVEGDTDEIRAQLSNVIAAATDDLPETVLDVKRAIDDEQREVLWKIRKASNPLLNRQPGNQQALSFIEDAAIPPSQLPEYLEAVGEVLQRHELRASVFGHAGQGVLHIKPFLNLKTETDRDDLLAVSKRVHQLVLEFGGAISGEHGDGLLRSQYLKTMYGETIYRQFKRVKAAFDPDGVFNPDKVVPADDNSLHQMSENLRYNNYTPELIDTELDFSDEGGFASLVEQCNGCSKCRAETDGVMCPSYRGAKTELTSTRGRANLLRAAINGELGDDALTSDWFQSEVLDLCLSCKACETECPTGVDMAKLKTEAKHQKYRREGIPLRARLFGNVRRMNRIGSLFAPLVNPVADFGPARAVAERILGIDRRRTLPQFSQTSLFDWMASRPETDSDGRRVVLFPDCYTTYNRPNVGKAAVKLLERLGYDVQMLEFECCGRPALSQGLVETATSHAAANAELLDELSPETPVVSVEPSCVSAFYEYDDLIDNSPSTNAVMTISSFLLEEADAGKIEFPTVEPSQSVSLHGHCHSKTKGWDIATYDLLCRVGYDVYPIDVTCCGMAGSFGYETEHYDLSLEIASDLIERLEEVDSDLVATSGASCTHQLIDHDYDPVHPIELL